MQCMPLTIVHPPSHKTMRLQFRTLDSHSKVQYILVYTTVYTSVVVYCMICLNKLFYTYAPPVVEAVFPVQFCSLNIFFGDGFSSNRRPQCRFWHRASLLWVYRPVYAQLFGFFFVVGEGMGARVFEMLPSPLSAFPPKCLFPPLSARQGASLNESPPAVPFAPLSAKNRKAIGVVGDASASLPSFFLHLFPTFHFLINNWDFLFFFAFLAMGLASSTNPPNI